MLNKILVILAIVLAAIGFNAYSVHQAKVETTAKIEQKYKEETIRIKEQADVVTQDLKDKLEKVQDEKQTQVNSANAKYSALLASLRKQSISSTSESPATISSNSEITTGNNTEGLPLGIGESLAAEAYRAEIIRANLLSCYKQYDEVRDAFETFRKLP